MDQDCSENRGHSERMVEVVLTKGRFELNFYLRGQGMLEGSSVFLVKGPIHFCWFGNYRVSGISGVPWMEVLQSLEDSGVGRWEFETGEIRWIKR